MVVFFFIPVSLAYARFGNDHLSVVRGDVLGGPECSHVSILCFRCSILAVLSA